ncbi:MAG: hypothetical protein KDA86_22425 [Planctomycetaceae bacterium]|nr:hypothetical protein [Planctomycetaceae bacterium]
MPAPFFERLRDYYRDVATVLRGESSASSIFPNTSDIGTSREVVYRKFLKEHLPSACNVMLGGFLFNQQGEDSGQIDIIVTIEDCPQFNFTSPEGNGKSFSCVDGTLAVASIKSHLNSNELRNALKNLASVPQHRVAFDWPSLGIENPFYEEWPYKIIFANDGISEETLRQTMIDFYTERPDIPSNRRPNMIHVAGKFCIRRTFTDLEYMGDTIKAGTYFTTTADVDVASLVVVVHSIQQGLAASRYIPFDYSELFSGMFGMKER